MQEGRRDLGSSDSCNLAIPCPGRCGDGSFQLETRFQEAIEANESAFEAVVKCAINCYGTLSDPCSFELRYRAEIVFKPKPEPKPEPEPEPAA